MGRLLCNGFSSLNTKQDELEPFTNQNKFDIIEELYGVLLAQNAKMLVKHCLISNVKINYICFKNVI